MKTFKVTIVANNAAGAWSSWSEKTAAIRAFYAPVCDLQIQFSNIALTPKFMPYEGVSGAGTVYRIDEAWYQQNVSPLARGADIVVFVVPPSDHPNIVTLMGIETGDALGNWETTVFSDENSKTYVNGAEEGNTFVIYTLHELAHVFYAMLNKADNTHLYFYAGTPEKVLADFTFDMDGPKTQLIALYNQLILTLKALASALIAKKKA